MENITVTVEGVSLQKLQSLFVLAIYNGWCQEDTVRWASMRGGRQLELDGTPTKIAALLVAWEKGETSGIAQELVKFENSFTDHEQNEQEQSNS